MSSSPIAMSFSSGSSIQFTLLARMMPWGEKQKTFLREYLLVWYRTSQSIINNVSLISFMPWIKSVNVTVEQSREPINTYPKDVLGNDGHLFVLLQYFLRSFHGPLLCLALILLHLFQLIKLLHLFLNVTFQFWDGQYTPRILNSAVKAAQGFLYPMVQH